MMDIDKKYRVWYIILMMMLSACTHTDGRIIRYMRHYPISVGDSCFIDSEEVLEIEYDSMYLFSEYTNYQIPQVLRISQGNQICDSHKRIILFKNNDVVYIDDFPILNVDFADITERFYTTQSDYFEGYTHLVHYGSFYKVKCIGENRYVLFKQNAGKEQYSIYYDTLYHLLYIPIVEDGYNMVLPK